MRMRALRSCSEPQCVRVTTSGGSQSLCILSTYPYHGYGVAGPVTGAPPGLWGDIENPGPIVWDQGGKGVKVAEMLLFCGNVCTTQNFLWGSLRSPVARYSTYHFTPRIHLWAHTYACFVRRRDAFRTCETTGRVQDAGRDAFRTQDGAVCLHMMRRRRARRKMGKHSCAEMLPILRLKLAEMFAFGNRP